ncbi:proline racemase family protein [Paracoccus sp. N5]|uniref:proline racemase family protein n=1 Tax=Paracoccus sp. N5 TaxID=1101189 RepID=UPI00047661E0|nr:proline racemase family protein [Paracoccus sp. N5]
MARRGSAKAADCGTVSLAANNVQSACAAHLDAEIEVPHLVRVDVGWGGMFYVTADVRQFPGLELKPEHGCEVPGVGLVTGIRPARDDAPPPASRARDESLFCAGRALC